MAESPPRPPTFSPSSTVSIRLTPDATWTSATFRKTLTRRWKSLIPYATHTHIRDFYGGARRLPLDLDRMWQMFAKGGYQGFMSVEYEGEEDAMTGVPKLVEEVKMLCKKYSSGLTCCGRERKGRDRV